jgi:hypothetical protein
MTITATKLAPVTPADWHAVMQQHVTHELSVNSAYQAHAQTVRPQSVCYDGRMSAFVDSEWLPNVSMRLFFGSRTVTCRTCQPEPAHQHRFVIEQTYSATDATRFKQGRCQCGEVATFAVPAP